MIDLVLPIVVLIVSCVIGMIYSGGFFSGTGFIDAFSNSDASVGLMLGSAVTLVITVVYYMMRRVLSFKDAAACIPQGFVAMVPPMIILTLAVSLKTMTSSLGAADFVHDMMLGAAQGLYSLLPAVIFVVAVALAFASGTSWGTFGILIPIVVAIFPADSKLLIIGISACLAGAVCGDHCSPISDTTIMASAGAQVDHLRHVSTQLPYAMTVALVSFVTYIVAGFVQNAVISLAVGALLTVAVLMVFRGKVGSGENAAA